MFANIHTAIQDLQLGKMVIIVDDEEREIQNLIGWTD